MDFLLLSSLTESRDAARKLYYSDMKSECEGVEFVTKVNDIDNTLW